MSRRGIGTIPRLGELGFDLGTFCLELKYAMERVTEVSDISSVRNFRLIKSYIMIGNNLLL